MKAAQGSDKIRVGIVGANPDRSYAALTHLPALAALPGYELTAVSTTRRESAEKAAEKFGAQHAFDHSDALIEHPDVDLVVVSVRTQSHAEIIRAAFAAKKHVLSEWPIGVSLAESAELARGAELAGVRTVVGLQRRFAPGVRYFHDLIADGYVGRVRSVTVRVAVPYWGGQYLKGNADAADAANGSTALTLVAGHHLDPVLASVPEIESLSAVVARQFDKATIIETGETIPVSTPDQVLISATLSGGAVLSAHVEAGKRNGADIWATVTGTEGDLHLSGADGMVPGGLTVSGARGQGQTLAPLPAPEKYHTIPQADLTDVAHHTALLYDAVAKDWANGTETVPTFQEAWRKYRLLDTIERASTTGRRLDYEG
ncbi:Gfo/Idh/MocA family protein [Streptomyces muensis]|uniref:Gfo/Idh/MocA family oxidoreductase n=1 Tax=Streptomyces muensis TaxID=1077944 RepID=A0A9X1TIR7_STRM4|nr:Gfo/Idh/MocA family oxidoreductase [Streptomyces muensis]MCF1592542.1 Gfo/Idh/MocA family oxidoreductase [Streptomyces muensis]